MAEDALDRAMQRLDRALTALESRWSERAMHAQAQLFDALPADDARVAELETAILALRQREQALEQVASEASAALGRAAAEVRAALSAEA
jgi:hypothetical protein